MKFDAVAAWSRLSPAQQHAVGVAALLLQVAQEAQELAIDDPPTPALRRWEAAEQVAQQLLGLASPCDADLYADGPDLAALGIRACRICGCTDDHACPGGCEWVKADLCSACIDAATIAGSVAHSSFDNGDLDASPSLGSCCLCTGTTGVRNIIMLSRRGIIPGHGWGCVACALPSDGAYAVLCDACLPSWEADNAVLTIACRGFPATEGRIRIADLPPGVFDHDPGVDHG